MGFAPTPLTVKPVRKPDLSWKGSYELERWLINKKPSSLSINWTAWKHFKSFVEGELGKEFTHKALAKYLIDEIEKDQKKPARMKGEPQRRIERFHKARREQGASLNYTKSEVGNLMAFYRENGFKIKFTKRFSDLFPEGALPENRKQLINPSDLKKMLDNAKSLRDKAIMLVMYEGGMDLATLKSINYKQVADVELSETQFITLHLRREKEKWDYFTHLGSYSVEAIRRYIRERKANLRRRGETLKDGDPLFIKEWVKKGKHKRLTNRCIEKMVKDVAVRAGLLKLVILEKGRLAPIRPYSLRGSFSTLLENDKCPYNYRQFWLGHKIKYGGAYFTPSEQLSLTTYQEHYKALSVEEPSVTRDELNKRVQELETVNQSLLGRLTRLESFMKRHVKMAEEDMQRHDLYQEMREREIEEPILAR